MRLVRLELRGAIGINKGLGKDEILIDFSIFNEGLIAIVGENGRGKTTIIENLHPFRRLVSRNGNLSDHFYLKDSYRKLEFIYNGKLYRSEIYIDGITKKQEAYLKLGGLSLNDGKPSSYDEVLEELFGSEELFFNSLFSAQKSQGISELTSSQKRELFYELLGLNKYQFYLEEAKELLKESEILREKLLYQKSISEEALEKLPQHEKEYDQLTQRKLSLKKEISLIDEGLTLLIKRKSEDENMRISYEQKIKTNDSIFKKIEELENELSQRREEYNSKIALIKDEYLNHQPYLLDLKSLNKEAEEINLKIEELRKNESSLAITKEIILLQEEKEKVQAVMTQREEILKKEEELLELSFRQNELIDLIQKYREEENHLLQLQNEVSNNERKENEKLNTFYEEILELKNNLAGKSSQYELINLDRENLEITFKQKIESMNEEIRIIDQVPCDDELGAKCPLLNHAFITKAEIDLIKEEYEKKLLTLNQLLSNNALERSLMSEKINELTSTVTAKELEIAKNHAYRLGQITSQIDKLNILKKSTEYEIKSLKELNLDIKLQELHKAKTEVLISKEKIERLENLIASKEELKEKTEEKVKSQIEMMEEKLKSIQNKITFEEQKMEEEKLRQQKEYENRIAILNRELEYKSQELLKWIAKEKSNIDLTLDKKLKVVLENLELTEYEIKNTLLKKEDRVRILTENEARLFSIVHEIEKIKKVKVDLEGLDLRLRQVEKDITEYLFLIKAFDKTGIPVLKLENSGIQITSLANELLKNFKNDFRIAFETMRMTKDRKKNKEVFDINVIDQDGICELKNKSGGERIWIEASIQLALGILMRFQGRKLETSFLDEQDGALDFENAMSYRQMIEIAHKKAGLFNTIIISHRSELINLIDQKIILEEEGLYLKAS